MTPLIGPQACDSDVRFSLQRATTLCDSDSLPSTSSRLKHRSVTTICPPPFSPHTRTHQPPQPPSLRPPLCLEGGGVAAVLARSDEEFDAYSTPTRTGTPPTPRPGQPGPFLPKSPLNLKHGLRRSGSHAIELTGGTTSSAEASGTSPSPFASLSTPRTLFLKLLAVLQCRLEPRANLTSRCMVMG